MAVWLEDISIGFALGPAAEILLGVQAVLRDLSWWLGPRGTSFRGMTCRAENALLCLAKTVFVC